MNLSKKLHDIKFPSKVPNSPYPLKNMTPATPISMMMELNNWMKLNREKVVFLPEKEIAKATL